MKSPLYGGRCIQYMGMKASWSHRRSKRHSLIDKLSPNFNYFLSACWVPAIFLGVSHFRQDFCVVPMTSLMALGSQASTTASSSSSKNTADAFQLNGGTLKSSIKKWDSPL